MRYKSIIVTALLLLVSVDAKSIKVGVTASLKPNNMSKPGAPFVGIMMAPAIAGYRVAIDYVNEHIFPLTIDGEVYDNMELVLGEDEYDTEVAKQILTEWINTDAVDLFIAPYTTVADPAGGDPEQSATHILESNQKLVISAFTPYDYFSNYPRQWSFSVGTMISNYMMGTVIPLRIGGASTAIYIESGVGLVGMCNDDLTRFLKQNSIELLNRVPINDSNADENAPIDEWDPDMVQSFRQVFLDNKDSDPDVWYICAANSKVAKIFRDIMYEYDYTPRAMISRCGNTWAGFDGYNETKGYMMCIASDIPETKFVDPRFGTMDEFLQLYSNHANVSTYNTFAAAGALTVAIYGDLLKLAGTKDHYVLRDFLRRYTTTTYRGKISWNAHHAQENSGFLLQFNISNGLNAVSPYETKTADHVYPEPLWYERTYDKNRYAVAEIVFGIIAGICILSNIFWAVYLFFNREKAAFKAASPIFMYICILGSTLLYLYVYGKYPSVSDSVVACHLSNWALMLGFFLLFVPLFAKTWRVMRLFTRKSLAVIVITNAEVATIIGIVCLPPAILMCVLMGIHPSPGVTLNTVDIHRPYYDYYTCSTSTATKAISWTIVTYGLLLLLVGTYLGLKVRTIPFTIYDESKIIGFSIYNTGFFAILMIVISNIELSHINRYIVFCTLLIVANLITVNSLMIHKVYHIKKGTTNTSSNGSGLNTAKSINSKYELESPRQTQD